MLFSVTDTLTEAGVDEAGRGPMAGPVTAAAVILPRNFVDTRLRDSKKMSAANRIAVAQHIKNEALAWSIAEVDHTQIDSLNILQATFLAMNTAIKALQIRPDLLIIDGNRFVTDCHIEYRCFVGGDNTYLSIAAASVLAKTARDAKMELLDRLYPQYDWAHNKGYPTVQHKLAVARYGVSPYHRRTFAGVREYCNTLFDPHNTL